MYVEAAIMVLRPDGLDLVVLGDRGGPSLGCTVGAKVGVEIGCSWFGFRR